jgi:hypothetical protein
MAYGNDITVFVEDKAGDLGAPGSSPSWLSPDVDMPAHPGEAVQGSNQVQVRVHANDEPFLTDKIIAEVYVGKPGLVLSPTTGTKRIDPGTLLFRQGGAGVTGPEPVVDAFGATRTFSWTPSASAADVDGPGHRCLIVRAFPVGVTPPSTPFDVPNERHEAQHNIEVLSTTTASAGRDRGGAGTRRDPRRRDKATGLWWEELGTMAVNRRGKRFVVCAFDPRPSKEVVGRLAKALEQAKVSGLSRKAPSQVTLEAVRTPSEAVDPRRLLKNRKFAKRAGLGEGLFAEDRLLSAAAVELGPRTLSQLVLRFDHSNIRERSAAVLHVAQWSENGDPEGGMTVVAVAPVAR